MSLNYESGYGSGYEGDAGGFVSDSGFDTATGTRTPLKPSSVAPPMAQTAAIAAAKLAQQQLLLSQQKAAVASPAAGASLSLSHILPTSPTPRSSQAAAALLEVPLSRAEKVRLDIETLKRETIESFKLNVDDSVDVETILEAALIAAERERLLNVAATAGGGEGSSSTQTTTQQPLLIRKFVAKHYDLSVDLAIALEEEEKEKDVPLEGEEQMTARVKALIPLYNPPPPPPSGELSNKVLTPESSSTESASASSLTATIAAELHAMRVLSEAQYLLLTHEAATRRREHEELITLLQKPLQKRGMSILELRQCGYTCANLRAAGYTLSEMLDSRCISIVELKAERFTAADLKAAGCSANELKAAFTASECRGGGFSFEELIKASFPLSELRIAGVPGKDMVNRVGEDELLKAGYRRSVADGGWSNF